MGSLNILCNPWKLRNLSDRLNTCRKKTWKENESQRNEEKKKKRSITLRKKRKKNGTNRKNRKNKRKKKRRRNGWTKETMIGITAAPPLQSLSDFLTHPPACMQVSAWSQATIAPNSQHTDTPRWIPTLTIQTTKFDTIRLYSSPRSASSSCSSFAAVSAAVSSRGLFALGPTFWLVLSSLVRGQTPVLWSYWKTGFLLFPSNPDSNGKKKALTTCGSGQFAPET